MFKITETEKGLRLSGLDRFSISKIFDCGQCFRFDPIKGGIEGVAHGKVLRFEQPDSTTVNITGINKGDFDSVFCRYLALDEDYEWALVGSKSPKYLWILSRTRQLDATTKLKICDIAQRRGYDTRDLIWVKQ